MRRNLLIVILCFIIPAMSVAQDLDTATIKLDEIIIAENRIQMPYAEQSRSISLIDKELISKTPALSYLIYLALF